MITYSRARLAAGLASIGGVFALGLTLSATEAPRRGREAHSPARTAQAVPMVFEQNIGQNDSDAQFLARGRGFTLGLNGAETVLALRSRTKESRIKVRLVGANPKPKTLGEKRLKARINYFLGDDPKKWKTDVPAFAQVRTQNVYPGIDLVHYSQDEGALEYDFIVRPGADPDQVEFKVEGAERLELEPSGDLLIQSASGEVRQHKPVCYQEREGERVSVAGDFSLSPDGKNVSFDLGEYDPELSLVIDPVLSYSTYLGGSGNETAYAVESGANGLLYIGGGTDSTDFPLTSGAVQSSLGCAFLVVLDRNQTGAASLVYATYLGGNFLDSVRTIRLDAAGRPVLSGITFSANFPTTADRYQGPPGGSWMNCFVTVLDITQSGAAALAYSTYLGGDGDDQPQAAQIDEYGRVVIAGGTTSSNFPTTAGAIQGHSGSYDGFLTILDPSQAGAAGLIYSSCLGGISSDYFRDLELDESGRAFLCGDTESTDFPTSAGAIRTAKAGYDGFFCVLDPSQSGASALVYSTYVGGTGLDSCFGLDIDSSNRAWIAGQTDSADFPTTANAYQGPQGSRDVFVSLIDPTQTGLAGILYGTYLGGAGMEYARAVHLDDSGKLVLAGDTGSNNFPMTVGALQSDQTGDDSFVAVLDPNQAGSAALLYSTYLGGNDREILFAVTFGSNGNLYLASNSKSTDYPTTAVKFQGNQSLDDAVVSIVSLAPETPTGLIATPGSTSRTMVLTWPDSSNHETGYRIERRNSSGNFVQIGSTAANATTFLDNSLAANTAYAYRIRSMWYSYVSDPSNVAEATTLPLPAAPSDLEATALTASQVGLQWTDNTSDETGFRIERKTGSGSFAQVGTVFANVTTYKSSGLAADTAYTFRVRAYRVSDLSAYSDEAGATTPPLPATPNGLVATVLSSTQIRLNWADNSSDESGFKIERKTGSGSFAPTGTVSANVTTYTSSSLTAGTGYTFRLRAYRGTDYSAYSGEAEATAFPLPSAPAGLVATALSTTQIVLNWADNSSDESGFKIERKEGSGAFAQAGSAVANATTYTTSNLSAATTYRFRVRAYRGSDNSAYSGEAEATTLPLPATPTGLVATVLSSTQIRLNWADNSSDESGFKIERKEGTGSFTQAGRAGANATTFTSSNLRAATTYRFRVRAYRGSDNSAFSGEAEATTLPLPATPTGLVATVLSSTQIRLNWADNSSDESGFRIERKTGSGTFAQVGSVAANVTTFTSSGLAPGTAYTFRVRAYRGTDNSVYSNEASQNTLP